MSPNGVAENQPEIRPSAVGHPTGASAPVGAALPVEPSDAFTFGAQVESLLKRGEQAAALEVCRRQLQANPLSLDVLRRYAGILSELGRVDEAIDAYDRALGLAPDAPELINSRACVLGRLGRHEQALKDFDRALQLAPRYATALVNRGKALRRLNRLADAIASFDQALAIEPESVPALGGMASALQEASAFDVATTYYERACALDRDQELLLGGWIDCKLSVCDWRDMETLQADAVRKIDEGILVAGPFTLLGITDDPERQRRAAEMYRLRFHSAIPGSARPAGRRSSDRIRVGYFSGDFRNHPVSFLTAGLFEAHDRNKFHLTGFSLGTSATDEMRRRIEPAFDEFIEVGHLGDAGIVEEARRREIDLAVDLGGYTGSSRPGIFVAGVAPIQVGYLGYPGTMGSGVLDYLIADRTIIADDDRDFYAEKVVLLPSYQVNDSRRGIAEQTMARGSAGLPDDDFVYCCFNDPRKIGPALFERWLRILGRVRGSVLWLSGHKTAAVGNLRKEMERRGLDPARLVFAERVARLEDHLARYRLADLFLDTLPYNAHTTASDALWAGLPVLTCQGRSFPGRVAASLLHAIGLPELIAATPDEYEERAVKLALGHGELALLKARLQANRMEKPLFDTRAFARSIEAAYLEMHRRQQAGLPPESFSV